MNKSVNYQDRLISALKDSEEAAAYLNAALEEIDPRVFLIALKNVAEAQGGMSALARKAELNRESLYRTLSDKGNPALRTLDKLLHSLGFKLAVQVDDRALV